MPKMNKIHIVSYCCFVLSLCACTLDEFSPEEWAIEPELSLSSSYVAFNSAVGTYSVDVTTNYESFTVSSNEDWCHVQADVDSMRIALEVNPNNTAEQRMATIYVTIARGSKTMTKELTVIQFGGIWDNIGEFQVYWRNEVGEGQREAIVELLENQIYVEGSTFTMGKDNDEHEVTLSSYYIGKYEVTQRQWNAVMYENPSQYRGLDLPVENITWAEALEFVTKLSNLTGLNIALPTEAQWEYAAQGGKNSLGYKYPGSNDYTEVAHFVNGLLDKEHPLYTTVNGGSKLHNELGIYDMAGNVQELCFDWYDTDYSNVPTNVNPTGVATGTSKVKRGGDFASLYLLYETSFRWHYVSVTSRQELTGLRIVINM